MVIEFRRSFQIFCRRLLTTSFVSPEEYVERRRRLAELVKQQVPSNIADRALLIIVRASSRQFYAPDVPHPFRQCSYFRYLSGVSEPDCILKIYVAQSHDPVSTLYRPHKTDHEILWDGPGESPDCISKIYSITDIRSKDDLFSQLEKEVRGAVVSFDVNQFRANDMQIAQVLASGAFMIPLRELIDRLRWIKSTAEVQVMNKTCSIGARAMNAMINGIRDVANENEVIGQLELEMRKRGASCLAYPPVVSSGNRANIIHYLNANHPIKEEDVVLVDAGCEFEGYMSDITRVFPCSGRFSRTQLLLLNLLNDTQSYLIDFAMSTKPLRLNDLYLAMIHRLSQNVEEAGLFSRSLSGNELLHAAEELCPHHVSHYLGMDVHDTSSISRNAPLPPGVVFTLEPGIYVRNDNEVVKREFHGIGMRVEDDILSTKDGVKVLTEECVRSSHDIENLMNIT